MKRPSFLIVTALTAALALLPAFPIHATTTLFGIDPVALGSQDGLIQVNTLTAQMSLRGLTGRFAIRDIVWDDHRQVLYGANSNYANDTIELLSLNVNTGAANVIGTMNPAYGVVVGLAYDPFGDVLWGVAKHEVGLPQLQSSRLIRIDPLTGIVTDVGATSPLPNTFENVTELTFDHDLDILYGLDESGTLVTLDRSTGAASFVAGISHRYDPFFHTSLDGMAYLDGQIWMGDGSDAVRMDPTTGVFREIRGDRFGQTYGVDALAFQVSVPEPSRVVLVMVGWLLVLGRRYRPG